VLGGISATARRRARWSSRVYSKSNVILEKDLFEIYMIKQLVAVVGLDAGRLGLTWQRAAGRYEIVFDEHE